MPKFDHSFLDKCQDCGSYYDPADGICECGLSCICNKPLRECCCTDKDAKEAMRKAGKGSS